MKKFLLRTLAAAMAVSVLTVSGPSLGVALAAQEKTAIDKSIESFYSKWYNTSYEDGSNAFAEFMFKETFGHQFSENTEKSTYPISGVNKLYLKAKRGVMLEFKKGGDTYRVIYDSGDKDSITVYEAYSSPAGYIVLQSDYAITANDKKQVTYFMDNRFDGGSYTIYHSMSYDTLGHIHKFNNDGYCQCGSYRGSMVIPADEQMYVVKTASAYELPYAGSKTLTRLKSSQGTESVTAAVVNGDGEVWYKTQYGWIKGSNLSLEMSDSITKPKIPDSVQGIVTGIGSLPVRADSNSSYVAIGYFDEGSVITVTQKLNSWYKVDYNGQTGYVESRFVELLEKPEQ